MSLELHNTRMGQRLIESTLPTIGRELGQLNRNLDRIATAFEQKPEPTNPVTAAAPELLSAFVDLLDQLEAVGIYTPGQDEGQWADAAGLSFRRAEATIAKAEGRAA